MEKYIYTYILVNTSKERNVDASEVLVFAKSGPVKVNQG